MPRVSLGGSILIALELKPHHKEIGNALLVPERLALSSQATQRLRRHSVGRSIVFAEMLASVGWLDVTMVVAPLNGSIATA